MSLANTPAPPYFAVIFTSVKAPDNDGYAQTADEMLRLAAAQPGFLGVESAGDEALSITVSYWETEDAIANWRQHADHRAAQKAGQERWYRAYALRVARVERARTFP
jgi:heme-degrading monooxygenase HmoA